MTVDDEIVNNFSSRKIVGDNSVIMMFTPSLVRHAASPQLRLPANFVGVQSVRQDFQIRQSLSAQKSSKTNGSRFSGNADEKINPDLKASNDVKFCVVDENGNERRMTKAEKKAKKLEMAQAKKEAKKQNAARKKRKLEAMTVGDVDEMNIKESESMVNKEAMMEQHDQNLESSSLKQTEKNPLRSYHQLPLNPTTIEQEVAEFRGKRGSKPPVILSPPMALQFVSKNATLPSRKGFESPMKNDSCDGVGGNAMLVYDHNLSQEWANRLKHQCVLPAEAVRQREDLRPLAYRLHPEPWQRLRPSLEENRVVTRNRNDVKASQQSALSSPTGSAKAEKGIPTASCDNIPKALNWVLMTCRPRIKPFVLPASSIESTSKIQHDDVLSIVFEYIHRETPYYVSCGAKFGSDFLVYDGPRDTRHAFAGMRVLSRFTSSMTTISSRSTPESSLSQSNTDSAKLVSNDDDVELPLPTAYSLTGFVRCLNTAGKLALLATVDELFESDHDGDTEGNESSGGSSGAKKKRYRVAFVDVALEKVLDVHKRKNRGRSDKKKLQKRRDVTQTLSKT